MKKRIVLYCILQLLFACTSTHYLHPRVRINVARRRLCVPCLVVDFKRIGILNTPPLVAPKELCLLRATDIRCMLVMLLAESTVGVLLGSPIVLVRLNSLLASLTLIGVVAAETTVVTHD